MINTWLFYIKILNKNHLGVIHDDERDEVFKWPSNLNFLHSLCIIIVDIFLLNLYRYFAL